MEEELKAYSLPEITLHSSKSDCWLTIHGKVYDVTNFLEDHPGGEDVILESAAKGDATNDFEDVGHSSTATSMLSSYLIGTLDTSSSSSSSRTGDAVQQSSKGVKKLGEENVAAKTTTLERQVSSSSSMKKFIVPLISLIVALGAWYYYSQNRPVAATTRHQWFHKGSM